MPFRPIKDLSGMRFHNLVAIECVGRRGKHALWLFKCLLCGGTLEIPGYAVSRHDSTTRACGCLRTKRPTSLSSPTGPLLPSVRSSDALPG